MVPDNFADHVALFDYEQKGENDMFMKKGDQLIVKDNSNVDWWLVHNLSTNLAAYVPASFITNLNDMSSRE